VKAQDPAKANLRSFKSRPDWETAPVTRIRIEGADLAKLLTRRPLVVEIGCGVGLHPIQYAQQHADKNIVAIERTREKFQKFEGRLRAHPQLQERICAVHADAIHFLDQTLKDSSLDEVWILYPNPETAKPSRRWFQAPFMGRLVELMRPGGVLYFATNLEDYAKTSTAISSSLGLKVLRGERIQSSTTPHFAPRTHFEKKYFERGETLFNFEFRLEKAEV
jgi:tRNA (guanine-N7-)-methyltransferase